MAEAFPIRVGNRLSPRAYQPPKKKVPLYQ